jgi:hypothetical protein
MTDISLGFCFEPRVVLDHFRAKDRNSPERIDEALRRSIKE